MRLAAAFLLIISQIGCAALDGETFEAGAGNILVIKAGEVHSFRCVGDGPLVQMDVHLSATFIQENLV